MRLDFAEARVLAVVAHPDDAELLCAGTLARARDDGAVIGICVLCRGDKGQTNRPANAPCRGETPPALAGETPAATAARRGREMAASARLLDAKLYAGRQSDGTLADDTRQRRGLIEVYRQFKPSLVLAHAPEDYHPDHRAASALAEAASWFCASRGHKTRSAALSTPPELWWMDTVGMNGFEPGFFVDISEQIELKKRLLACHRSQLQRGKDADFSPLTEMMRLQAQARGCQAGVDAAEAFRAYHAFKRTRAW